MAGSKGFDPSREWLGIPAVDQADPATPRDIEIRLRPPPRRPSKSKSPVPAILSLLVAVAAVVAAYVVWPQTPAGGGKVRRLIANGTERPQQRTEPAAAASKTPLDQARTPSVDTVWLLGDDRPAEAAEPPSEPNAPAEPDTSPEPDGAPEPAPSAEPDSTAPATAEARHDAPEGAAQMPAPADSRPSPDGLPQLGPEQRARVAANVDTRLRSALSAMRRGAFDTADEETAAADRLVEDDERLADRVACWLQFARYARQLSEYRARALLAAPADCDVGGTQISIVESTPTVFKFKAAGRMYRMLPADVPPKIVDALVRRWFAARDQPGNHVFLGCHLILRDPPDVDGARKEWAVAKQGGQDVTLLEPLLDDPLIRGPRQ